MRPAKIARVINWPKQILRRIFASNVHFLPRKEDQFLRIFGPSTKSDVLFLRSLRYICASPLYLKSVVRIPPIIV
jgi:hypothetical protein